VRAFSMRPNLEAPGHDTEIENLADCILDNTFQKC
jgi:hypothetical protein